MAETNLPTIATIPEQQPELNSARAEQFIAAGIDLIQQGRYKDAIEYFRNADVARQSGLYLSLSRVSMVDQDGIHQIGISNIANRVAMDSMFMIDQVKILLSGVLSTDGAPLPPHLLHNIALVHAEEWIHGLQYLRQSPVAGHQDHEIDVALYLIQHHIPLTPEFLARYDRGLVIYKNNGTDDSGQSVPALRRGTFINITRSNGSLDTDWQIENFDSANGEIHAIKFVHEGTKTIKLQKIVPPRQSISNDNIICHPFTHAISWSQLFETLDQRVAVFATGIDGSGQITSYQYPSRKLKNIINRIRQGSLTTDHLPRAGGLRDKVIDLLKTTTSP